jgi:hypothetical protein
MTEDEKKQREIEEKRRKLLILILLLLSLQRTTYAQLFAAFFSLRGSVPPKNEIRDDLQDAFSAAVVQIAPLAVALTTLDMWHAQMQRAVRNHLFMQEMAARGRELLPTEELRLEQNEVAEQIAYVERFHAEIESNLEAEAAGETASAVTPEGVAARSDLYSGAGRAKWFRADEEGSPDGIVIDYFAIDDAGTCAPCHKADSESPYLPGTGPMPGEVCLGRGRCRCVRVPRRSMTEWRRLSGIPRHASEPGFSANT